MNAWVAAIACLVLIRLAAGQAVAAARTRGPGYFTLAAFLGAPGVVFGAWAIYRLIVWVAS